MVVVSDPPPLLTWPRCLQLFFCTYRYSRIWKGGIFLMLQRLNKNCWQPSTAFLLKILDNFSSSGSSARITASSHRRSTLKGTKVTNLYEYFKYIFCNNSRNFLVLPRRSMWKFCCPCYNIWECLEMKLSLLQYLSVSGNVDVLATILVVYVSVAVLLNNKWSVCKCSCPCYNTWIVWSFSNPCYNTWSIWKCSFQSARFCWQCWMWPFHAWQLP